MMNKNKLATNLQIELNKIIEQCKAYLVVLPKSNSEALVVIEHLKTQLETLHSETIEYTTCSNINTDKLITERENEVLVLIAKGYPNKEIAYQLSISIKTVQFHIKNLFNKLKATSRTEVVTKAIKNNLLEI